ncbi:MAG: Spermidine/putrescine import ATP-binding protein PotA [Anaerolineales bacterium]|nr:Spermidine/putrescine import ATP-binding protein PotA [Anaerolineales bacterium]
MTALTLDRVGKDFATQDGCVSVLQDLTLAVESGELLTLLGPSGCGKTTTLRLIAGLLDPTAGDVRFDGRSVLPVPAEKRGAVMVFQQHLLFPFMSVADNVAFGLKMRGVPRAERRRRVAEVLELVRLPGFGDRWPDELSGGQRQRVALARALVVEPRLLLLDEPLSNLDAELREEMRAEIVRLQQRAGTTTIFVTHDQTEAVTVADRIALMLDGRILQVGVPRDFYETPATPRVAQFFGTTNIFAARKRGDVIDVNWGSLVVGESPLPDGPVLATIRPEAIQFGRNGANTLSARVTAWNYRGDSARCVAVAGDTQLEISAPPYVSHQPGETITIHLPRERIWLMPAAGG